MWNIVEAVIGEEIFIRLLLFSLSAFRKSSGIYGTGSMMKGPIPTSCTSLHSFYSAVKSGLSPDYVDLSAEV